MKTLQGGIGENVGIASGVILYQILSWCYMQG